MIQLTKLNGDRLILNALMIEQVQSCPDTTITLSTGKKLVVKDSEFDVLRLATDYYKQIGLAGRCRQVGVNNG